MSDPMKDHVLAADGGGTRCRMALASPDGDVRVEVGAANVTTDFEGAVRQLKAGLQQLADKAGLSFEQLAEVPAYLGLAGFQVPADRDRLSERLALRRLKVEDDRPAALAGALETRNGALVHSGTGSFFGVQKNGKIRFAGGWGSILGDEGSAAWLGRECLKLVLHAEDGLLERTALTKALRQRFVGPAGIVAFASTASPADFGSLAPQIMTNPDDPAAAHLIHQAAEHFERTLLGLGWTERDPVCLSGGLAPHLAEHLTAPVRHAFTDATGSPLDGAIALARQFAVNS